MSYTKTLIANMAMVHIGDRDIADIDDQFDTDALVLKRFYIHARNAIYEAHDWKWAKRAVELQLLPAAPVVRYTRAFQMPSEFRRIANVSEFSDMRMQLNDFDISNGQFNCDVGFCHMEYVSSDWSEAVWPAYFADCVSLKLAALCAPRITHDSTAKQVLEKLLRDATLPYARSIDSGSQPPNKRVISSPWQTARMGGRNFNNLRRY